MTSYHIDINIYIYIYIHQLYWPFTSLYSDPQLMVVSSNHWSAWSLLISNSSLAWETSSSTKITRLPPLPPLPDPKSSQSHRVKKNPLASWNKLINLHDKLINTRSMWQSQDRPKPRSHQESIHWDSLGPQTFWKMCDLSCWHRAEVTRFLHGTALFVWSLCISKTIIIEECMNATWRNIALLLEFHFNVTRLLINWGWWSKLL